MDKPDTNVYDFSKLGIEDDSQFNIEQWMLDGIPCKGGAIEKLRACDLMIYALIHSRTQNTPRGPQPLCMTNNKEIAAWVGYSFAKNAARTIHRLREKGLVREITYENNERAHVALYTPPEDVRNAAVKTTIYGWMRRKLGLCTTQLLVYAAVYSHSEAGAVIELSQKDLIHRTGMNSETVTSAMRSLIAAGHLRAAAGAGKEAGHDPDAESGPRLIRKADAARAAKETSSSLRDAFRQRRTDLGVSQVELAAGAGIKQTIITGFENGYYTPSLTKLIVLAETMGLRLVLVPKEPQKAEGS